MPGRLCDCMKVLLPSRFLRKLKAAASRSKTYKNFDYTVLPSDFLVRNVKLKRAEKGLYVTRVEGKN